MAFHRYNSVPRAAARVLVLDQSRVCKSGSRKDGCWRKLCVCVRESMCACMRACEGVLVCV